jgi:hypothetical protein
MTGSNSNRGLYQKGRIIDSVEAVCFAANVDMWDMQRSYNDYNDYYLYLLNIYVRIKYFKGLCGFNKAGV